MIKKISSLVLSLMLFGDMVFFAHLDAYSADRTENSNSQKYERDAGLHKNSDQQKIKKVIKSYQEPRTENESSTTENIILGTLGVTGAVIVGAFVYNTFSYVSYRRLLSSIDIPVGTLRASEKSRELIPGDPSIKYTIDDNEWNSLIDYGNANIPLRAFRGHDNLCWLHNSLLLFYYNPPTREAILKFPADDAIKMLKSQDVSLSNQNKANLLAMAYLSKIFIALQGKPGDTQPYVLDLDPQFEQEAIEALIWAFKENGCQKKYIYGQNNFYCTKELMGILKKSCLNECVRGSSLASWASECKNLLKDVELQTSDDGGTQFPGDYSMSFVDSFFVHNPNVTLLNNQYGHYYLQLSLNQNKTITIGKSTSEGAEFMVDVNAQASVV